MSDDVRLLSIFGWDGMGWILFMLEVGSLRFEADGKKKKKKKNGGKKG